MKKTLVSLLLTLFAAGQLFAQQPNSFRNRNPYAFLPENGIQNTASPKVKKGGFSKSSNPGDTITLDLTNPANPPEFTYTPNGYWTETYNDADFTFFESQMFMFSHLIAGEGAGFWGAYWDGFTVSKNGSNQDYGQGSSGGWIAEQWGCMAGGGIKTDADGRVVKDANGKVEVEQDVPYLVGYWGFHMEEEWWYMHFGNLPPEPTHCFQTLFNDGQTYEAVGVYVNNHPWPYYGNINGDGFARPFEDGDYFHLIIHGLDANWEETGDSVVHVLAEFKDGELKQSADWEWVDLSSLGEVGGFYYTMRTTDFDYYGPRTAVYFCMDKLQVRVPAPVTGVVLNTHEQAIEQGATYQLTANVLPENASNRNVVWISRDENIATVSNEGLVTALSIDETFIVVRTEDGDFVDSCKIQVTEAVARVEDIALNITDSTLNVGETLQLISTITPSNADNQEVTWTSSNEDVATVSEDGLVTAIAEGTAMITATTTEGSHTASCEITVNRTQGIQSAEQRQRLSLEIFPNPVTASQIITIELPLSEQELVGATLTLYDNAGRIIATYTVTQKTMKIKSPSVTGVYFISVATSNGKVVTGKIVVE